MGSVLILAHQPAVAGYIGVQDGSKLARQTVSHHEILGLELGMPEYYRVGLKVASDWFDATGDSRFLRRSKTVMLRPSESSEKSA